MNGVGGGVSPSAGGNVRPFVASRPDRTSAVAPPFMQGWTACPAQIDGACDLYAQVEKPVLPRAGIAG